MTDKPFPKNPYVIGVPLTGDIGFYGRRGVFTFVEDTLNAEHQNVIVLYGQRRVGKTSLLHQLVRQLKEDVVPVYFDLQGKEQHSLGQVLYSLARTIARPLKMSAPEQAKFDNAGRFFHDEFLPSVYTRLGQRRLLLLFDEFDVFSDELNTPEPAAETLFPYLQSLIMHERQVVFIFVVGRRIEELATHFQAIFKQAAYRRVSLLKPEDALALIVEPAKIVLTFAESAIEAILKLTAGHPYFTQLLCSEIFNAMKTKKQHVVAEADILNLVDQAIESGHGALTWFWDGLPRAERFIMSAVAHVTDETGLASKEAIRQILEKHRIILTGLELTDAPDKLVEWEMLRREGPDNYRFVVELVRRWIIKTHPLESARRDIQYISQRAVRLYENAREAHSAGDLEYARDEYHRTLAANPNHSGAQLGLAQVLFELGQIEAAIEEFTKAYAFDEMSARDGLVQARLAQGQKLEETGQQNEAMLQYEHAYKISPNDEYTRRRLANIWQERGDAILATEGLVATLEPYQKALDFDPGDAIAEKIRLKFDDHIHQAEADQKYDQAIKAIEQLQKLGLIDKDEEERRLANILLERGHRTLATTDLMGAIEIYQQALSFNRHETITRSIQAKLEAYADQAETNQNYAEAIEAIHQLRNLLPKDGSTLDLEIAFWTRRGDSLAKEGEGAEAIRAYQHVLELSPNDATATEKLKAVSTEWEKLLETDRLFNQAIVAHQAGEWPTAEKNWLQLIKMDVLNYKGHNLARLLAEASEASHRLGQEHQPLKAEIFETQPPAFPQKRDFHPYIWVAGGAIVVLIIGGIIFSTYQASPNASATTNGEMAQVVIDEVTKTTSDIAATPEVTGTTIVQATNTPEIRTSIIALAIPTPSTEAETTTPTVAQATTPTKSIATVTAEAIKSATANAQAPLATVTARATSGGNIPRTTAQATRLAQVQATVTARVISSATAEADISATANAQATKLAQVQAAVTARAQGILFQDDFSSNTNGWEGSNSNEGFNVAAQVTEGKYQQQIIWKQGGWITRTRVPNFSAKDFFLTFDTTIIEASTLEDKTPQVMIFFRYKNGQYYAVHFSNAGTFVHIVKEEAQFWEGIIVDWKATDAYELTQGISNSFGVLVKDSRITVYANGQELTTANDTTLSDASEIALGIQGLYTGQKVTVEFDNVVIKEAP